MSGIELAPDLIRRVLVATGFDNCDSLFWREDDGVLTLAAHCSDFFGWGIADCEPIETEADVEMLEDALADLRFVTNDRYPIWLTELYATRRRKAKPAPMMFGVGKYAMPAEVQPLFRLAAPVSSVGEPGTNE